MTFPVFKKGQNVRLKIARHAPVPLVLNGKITQIDSGPAVTKDTNVFKIVRHKSTSRQNKPAPYVMA